MELPPVFADVSQDPTTQTMCVRFSVLGQIPICLSGYIPSEYGSLSGWGRDEPLLDCVDLLSNVWRGREQDQVK